MVNNAVLSIWKMLSEILIILKHTHARLTESKFILLNEEQASELKFELLGWRIATLFRKPADWEDGRLVSQRIVFAELELRLLLH